MLKRKIQVTGQLVLVMMLMLVSSSAFATLSVRAAFQNAALSIDGVTSSGSTDVNQVQVDTPAGADILAAYLYVSDVFGGGTTGDVTLNGTFIAAGSGDLLVPNENPANTSVYDVTSIIAPSITGGLQNFDYSESGSSDGAVLVVVYRNDDTEGTAIIMDGELAQAGDTTRLDFAEAYAGGDVIMSLASSFSFNAPDSGPQVTTVDVTTDSTISRRLTACAGGNDDGGFVAANGLLMTVGGIGDDAGNPDANCSGAASDDELYNLAEGNNVDATPFLQNGDTFVELATTNPSFDDNVFFLAFTTAFEVSEVDGEEIPNDDDTPNETVPEPSTLALVGLGLFGVGMNARRRRQKS